ncbi:MAG: hypothetical protein WBB91_00825 [Nostocoides sp.]|uniref:hypothetical protein n=1 Tax=Nostocoides sp. TaxID=1917966 RepID=UPI003C78A4F8
MNRKRTRRGLVALAGAAALIGGGISAGPAAAITDCRPYASEAEVLAETRPECRDTDIVSPALGSLLTRAQVEAASHIYAPFGFTAQWIWWAPETKISTGGKSWSYCGNTLGRADWNGPDGLCDDPAEGEVISDSLLDNYFSGNVELSVFGSDNAFIARMCGNFFPLTGNPQTYSPKLAGLKFEDGNQNGVQDPGESTVAGWEFAVERVSALYASQPAMPTQRVTTGADGKWELDIAAFGPGVYRVTEQSRTGWSPTTPESVEVTVDPGLGSGTLAVGSWGNTKVADVAKTSFAISSMPERFEVDEPGTVTVSGSLANLGPFSSTKVVDTVTLSGPSDCLITPARHDVTRQLAVGTPENFSVDFSVTCSKRSDHRFVAQDDLVPEAGVLDPDLSNNTATADATTEVFEEVDLEVEVAALDCTEREHNVMSSECVATLEISNHGPATAVTTLTNISFDVESDCTVVPATEDVEVVLDAHTTTVRSVTAVITCTASTRHTVRVSATLANAPSDPHAVDQDTATLQWLPNDTKPRSLPSSVNISKSGVLPFAILATAEFDPLADVDIDSLTYGVTGSEDSVIRCAPGGEDVNDDGLLDLVCHADTTATKITCTTTVLHLHGVLTSGEEFVSQDNVKVTGCRA